MFDGDEAGKRASYKAAVMSLPFLIPNKSIQFINLPNNTDPDNLLINNQGNNLVHLLKNPTKLLNYIFDTSISGISLNDADQKISYDNYIDELIESIKDKKIKYFYKNEFKSLFFNKLRSLSNKTKIKTIPKKVNSLKRKQVYSFIASAINHKEVRYQIVEEILANIELDDTENKILDYLTKVDINSVETVDIIKQFNEEIRKFVEAHVIQDDIYQLFPYSNPKFESETALIEIKESTNNLNTRLSNLKKINKSLNTFKEDNSSLNWEELQKISKELEENYKDS